MSDPTPSPASVREIMLSPDDIVVMNELVQAANHATARVNTALRVAAKAYGIADADFQRVRLDCTAKGTPALLRLLPIEPPAVAPAPPVKESGAPAPAGSPAPVEASA